MPNFTAPGQEARYQGTNAELIIGRIIPPPGGGGIPVTGPLLFSLDNTLDIGSADGGVTLLRPRTVYVGTSIVVGKNSAVGTGVAISSAAGQFRSLQFQTNLLPRWTLQGNNTAEGGADAGSDFNVAAFTDAGGLIDLPITITRAPGGSIALATTRALIYSADGTTDIGSSDAGTTLRRPRIVYVATAVEITIAGAGSRHQFDGLYSKGATDLYFIPGVGRAAHIYANNVPALDVTVNGGVTVVVDGATSVTSGLCFLNQTNGAGGQAGTLANSPVLGNPTFWLPVNIGGALKHVPAW